MRTAADLPEAVRDLIVQGRRAWLERNYQEAWCLFEQALIVAREIGSTFGQAGALHFLGNVAFNQCRDAEARRLHTDALELSRMDGDDQGIGTSLGSLALIDVAEGDLASARATYAEAVAAYERAGMAERAASLRGTAESLLVLPMPVEKFGSPPAALAAPLEHRSGPGGSPGAGKRRW